METSSLLNDPLHSQLRELYGRMVYTHKTQEKESDRASARLLYWQNAQLILSSMSATGVLATIWGDCVVIKIATAVISAILFGISAYLKNCDFGGRARCHAEAAAFLWDARERYLTMIVDLQSGKCDRSEICERRDELQTKLAAFFKSAPRTTAKSYQQASIALHKNDEFTFVDEEIDRFLPESLRLKRT